MRTIQDSTTGETIRYYGEFESFLDTPDLTELQRKAYRQFLQADVPYTERQDLGLESIIREIFPIHSYDKSVVLEYIGYDLGRPRYTIDECRKLRLTYGMPFKIRLRLVKAEPIVEDVYLGEIPILIGGGEFLVNGAERVIVNQLHRSPGVDFSLEVTADEKKLHSCWIIPERGSWIEVTVSKKVILQVRIDQSGKFPATLLLRAASDAYSTDADLLRLFYETETLPVASTDAFFKRARGAVVVEDIVDVATGEILCKAADPLAEEAVSRLLESSVPEIEVLKSIEDPLLLNTIREDRARTHEEALLLLYGRLRPGNPAQLEKARDLFREKFFDSARYRLGRVGRFRLNRKFHQTVPESEMTLTPEDLVNATKYLLLLRKGEGEIDDIDHLGNRRVRTIAELAGEEVRKGFLKLRRTAQERMNLETEENLTPRNLINAKTISAAIDFFFGRSELSQVVDQTNPLSQLTHERRLSALGPGGLNRKRAGFEVRDVHYSHYGRICPIETPEGTNIGLISSLSIYARTDSYGFLVTPYREVKNGKLTGAVRYLRADEEFEAVLAPADTAMDRKGSIRGDRVLARVGGEFQMVPPKEVQFVDCSPRQILGVSASLIPFLEHDDANRALMGSNMQRQAVPLLRTEKPRVFTGMERDVARNSGMVVTAKDEGVVERATASEVVVEGRRYPLRKFVGLNERTCLNQKPIVRPGQKVKRGDVLADGAGTQDGELALGRNVLVAFMPWEGYNFEDAILVSEQLVKQDVFTSVHIDEFEIEIRETKLGREEFTRDIPNVAEKMLQNLGEDGVVCVGTRVKPGDILVGKISPKSKSTLSPEEKLLHAIFGRAGEDVKNDSLEVPSGVEGIVIDTQRFSRKVNLSEEERESTSKEIKAIEREFLAFFYGELKEAYQQVEGILGKRVQDDLTGRPVRLDSAPSYQELRRLKEVLWKTCETLPQKRLREAVFRVIKEYGDRIDTAESEKNKKVNRLSRGDELPTGVLELVKVFIATKRRLSVGDKMAGRHGNKGVVARILPEEDMPYLEDGTPVDIVLNPLGVPSRMNVGQVLETHLGWAADKLNFRVLAPVFDGPPESSIEEALKEAGLPWDGKVMLFDGRTGAPFEQKVTVGIIYMLKLHHLVDDKVHARATGPYSLITQQPLGGKARFGGQRFGEMEVWALEAYGAAYVLQELLTVKSDDVDGRTRIYESMVKGENVLESGLPVSFEVLTNEIRGLGLNIEVKKRRKTL